MAFGLGGQDAWRRHPMLSGCWRGLTPFPGLAYAAGIFAVYLVCDTAWTQLTYTPTTGAHYKYTKEASLCRFFSHLRCRTLAKSQSSRATYERFSPLPTHKTGFAEERRASEVELRACRGYGAPLRAALARDGCDKCHCALCPQPAPRCSSGLLWCMVRQPRFLRGVSSTKRRLLRLGSSTSATMARLTTNPDAPAMTVEFRNSEGKRSIRVPEGDNAAVGLLKDSIER